MKRIEKRFNFLLCTLMQSAKMKAPKTAEVKDSNNFKDESLLSPLSEGNGDGALWVATENQSISTRSRALVW